MQIFHFGDLLSDIVSAHKDCPSIHQWVPMASMEAVTRRFDQAFPQYKQLRHAIAHAGEIKANTEKNAFRGAKTNGWFSMKKSNSMFFSQASEGRTFSTTRKGEILKFDMTFENLDRLTSTISELEEIFYPACEATQLMMRDRRYREAGYEPPPW